MLLRRKGLYSATLASFRKQQADGKLVIKNVQHEKRQRQDYTGIALLTLAQVHFGEAERRWPGVMKRC